ncbi:putative B2 bradykinin receptor-like [Scophthalmus maximus]|uniref:B2 bradykinin receptor n=1 Tax=Scophthalmus maximus TaxID=52904 RepID=A0A2U9CIC4_SCOMX|nr:putative B2 bradykinin receptor-like [Scophthalmus maximus]
MATVTSRHNSVPDFSTTSLYGDQNQTNGTQCHDPDDWEWLITSQPVYILLITVLGIVLNVFVLMVFCLHKKPCTVAEIYLSNLAVADLVLLSCLPFWAVNVSNDFNWPFGLFLCKVVNLGIKMNVYCSIYFLVLVSIDRYVALVHPMSHGRMRRPKYAKLSCLLTWVFGLILSVPTLIFRDVNYIPELDVNACFLDYQNDTLELLCDGLLVTFSFIIPILIISFCTVKIIQALKVQAVERFSAEKTEQRATTLILAVLLAFLVCWVPFHLVTMLDVLLRAEVLRGCHLTNFLEICNQISTYLAFLNSVLNPILYVIVGKNFRKKVRELCRQWSIKRRATTESTSSHLSSTLKTLK